MGRMINDAKRTGMTLGSIFLLEAILVDTEFIRLLFISLYRFSYTDFIYIYIFFIRVYGYVLLIFF